MTMKIYRFLDHEGNQCWTGKAHDPEHAEERAFWDETPGSLERFTLQRWGRVRLTSEITADGWVTVYKDRCLAPV